MRAVLGSGERGVVALPVAAYAVDPKAFVADVLERSWQSRTTQIELGVVDSVERDAAALHELAAVRRDGVYSFRLSCAVPSVPDCVDASLLRAAGVWRVRVDPGPSAGDHVPSRGMEAALLERVELVAALEEQGVAASWHLAVTPHASENAHFTAELLASFHHLTPPVGTWPEVSHAPGVSTLQQAVLEWRRNWVPNTLTYGRGPGFVRIYDRRAPAEGVAYIALNGPQAAVFLTAKRASAAEDLAVVAEGVPLETLRSFLGKLVARRLMCLTTSGLYQSLPTRRRMEERWVSGEV